ncbi:hypothetical protein BRADI_4g24718v3 [Brachypodium distachyon]|uniref:Uncharacterized protein n=1 Tax=Brachypodium distachyon TaxID=15368 RepID=A0A0Q3H7C5_BRADI|nr:hypothetical protein BRADI_4g24718v3 [Brachypodium distachyon]
MRREESALLQPGVAAGRPAWGIGEDRCRRRNRRRIRVGKTTEKAGGESPLPARGQAYGSAGGRGAFAGWEALRKLASKIAATGLIGPVWAGHPEFPIRSPSPSFRLLSRTRNAPSLGGQAPTAAAGEERRRLSPLLLRRQEVTKILSSSPPRLEPFR